MNQCKCGRNIPKGWPMCGECVVAAKLPYEAPDVRRSRLLTRRFHVLTRMQQRKVLLGRLAASRPDDQATPGTQAVPGTQAIPGTPVSRDEQEAMILRARRVAKRREHTRVRESFDTWLDQVGD